MEPTAMNPEPHAHDVTGRTHRRRVLFGTVSAVVAVAALGLGGVALAGGGGDDEGEVDTPITGTALEQASAAALTATGGGTVVETEVGDEESMYEVEVRLDDGSSVDVQLDASFTVVSTEADTEDEAADGDAD